MKKLLKKYFIPHEENDHQPHILRREAVVFVGIVALGIEALFLLNYSGILPTSKLTALVLPSVLVDETNANRVSDALPPLKPDALLELAAREKANDMATNGYFAHTSPSGLTPWYWFEKAGYNFIFAGENLAVNFTDSEDVINAWMNSPLHRENILNGNFTEIGIATAQGTYNGKPAVFAVQLFGTPAHAASYVPSKPVAQAGAQGAGSAVKPVILGESSSSDKSGESTFIAVKGAENAGVSFNAELAAAAPMKVSNGTANILASPRKTVSYVFYAVAIFIMLALLLNVFIKIEIQHDYLILNGVYLLVFLAAMLIFNHYLTAQQITVL